MTILAIALAWAFVCFVIRALVGPGKSHPCGRLWCSRCPGRWRSYWKWHRRGRGLSLPKGWTYAPISINERREVISVPTFRVNFPGPMAPPPSAS